jgi:hypothetical protein
MIAFEATLLIKPPTLSVVSDSFIEAFNARFREECLNQH